MKKKKLVAFLLSALMLISNQSIALAETIEDDSIKDYFSPTELVSTSEDISNGLYKFSYIENGSSVARSSADSKVKTDVVYVAIDDSDRATVNSLLRQRGYVSRDKLDSTCSCKIFTKVYFEEDGAYMWLTKVTGGYTRKDATVSVVSGYLEFGQVGGFTKYHRSLEVNAQSFTCVPYSSWEKVNVNNGIGVRVGSTYTVTLKRNANPWKVELVNDVICTNSWSWG